MTKASKMALCAGSASVDLAKAIASHLHTRLIKTESGTFSDGETRVEITQHVRGRDVYVVQSTNAPQNDNLMELILLADALNRSDVRSLTAIVPYMGYARQDTRQKKERTPISGRVVADMIQNIGYSRVITVDIHARQIQGFYGTPFTSIEAAPNFVADIWHKFEERPIIVSPDAGGTERARYIAKQVGTDMAVIDKRRPNPNEARVMNILSEVEIEGRDCAIVDDMADTVGTLDKASDALKDKGARRVYAYCTHPVLSGPAVERIANSSLEQLVVTDTIPLSKEAFDTGKLRVISMSSTIAETLRRIHQHESVSLMYG